MWQIALIPKKFKEKRSSLRLAVFHLPFTTLIMCFFFVFSIDPLSDLLEWARTFSGFDEKKILATRDLKMGRFMVKTSLPVLHSA